MGKIYVIYIMIIIYSQFKIEIDKNLLSDIIEDVENVLNKNLSDNIGKNILDNPVEIPIFLEEDFPNGNKKMNFCLNINIKNIMMLPQQSNKRLLIKNDLKKESKNVGISFKDDILSVVAKNISLNLEVGGNMFNNFEAITDMTLNKINLNYNLKKEFKEGSVLSFPIIGEYNILKFDIPEPTPVKNNKKLNFNNKETNSNASTNDYDNSSTSTEKSDTNSFLSKNSLKKSGSITSAPNKVFENNDNESFLSKKKYSNFDTNSLTSKSDSVLTGENDFDTNSNLDPFQINKYKQVGVYDLGLSISKFNNINDNIIIEANFFRENSNKKRTCI